MSTKVIHMGEWLCIPLLTEFLITGKRRHNRICRYTLKFRNKPFPGNQCLQMTNWIYFLEWRNCVLVPEFFQIKYYGFK